MSTDFDEQELANAVEQVLRENEELLELVKANNIEIEALRTANETLEQRNRTLQSELYNSRERSKRLKRRPIEAGGDGN